MTSAMAMDTVYVGRDAQVFGDAGVSDHARIRDGARVSGRAEVYGNDPSPDQSEQMPFLANDLMWDPTRGSTSGSAARDQLRHATCRGTRCAEIAESVELWSLGTPLFHVPTTSAVASALPLNATLPDLLER